MQVVLLPGLEVPDDQAQVLVGVHTDDFRPLRRKAAKGHRVVYARSERIRIHTGRCFMHLLQLRTRNGANAQYSNNSTALTIHPLLQVPKMRVSSIEPV